MKKALLCLFALLALSGCSLYQPVIDQGNEEALLASAKVKPGMNKQQIADIMGMPQEVAPFDEDVWEYWFVRSKGTHIEQKQGIQMHFKHNRLIQITPLT